MNPYRFFRRCTACLVPCLTALLPMPGMAAPSTDAPRDALHELAALPDEDLGMARAALVIAREIDSAVDVEGMLQRVDTLAEDLRPRIAAASSPEERLAAMAEAIYGEWRFGAGSGTAPGVYVGFHEVLERRQWNCFGMTVLYLALAERLDLPLAMVSGHGHVFIEYQGEPPLYVETTDNGRVHRSKAYLDGFLPFPCLDVDAYQPVDKRRALAVLLSQSALAMQHRAQPALAERLFRAALAFEPEHAEALAGLGFLRLAASRIDAAVALFREALDADPAFREAHGGLGSALHAKGDPEGALDAFRTVTELCPDEPKAVFNLAQLLYETGRVDEAISAFRRYIELEPDDPGGYARLAFPLEDQGELDEALAMYRKAIERNPRFVDAYVNMGLIHEQLGEFAEAARVFGRVLQMVPRHPDALAGSGRALIGLGRTAEGLAEIERAIEINPRDAYLWMDLGDALRDTGRPAEAVDAYQQAIQRGPDLPGGFTGLARAYLALGEVDSARAAAAQALERGGDLPPELAGLLDRN